MSACLARAIAGAAMVVAPQLLLPGVAIAQTPHPLVGTWSIEYERGRRVENGEVTPIMGTGRLTIEQRGDSLVATFAPAARPDGTVPPPSTTSAMIAAPEVVFTQEQSVTINMNGEEQVRRITLTWSLIASGDALSGTLRRDLPMSPEPLPPTPVKGTRQPG